MSYIVRRPLGASFADYISKARNISGIGFGDGQTTLVFAAAVLALVSYLAIVQPDIQPSLGTEDGGSDTTSVRAVAITPELE
jgi:uncharacterized membrane-anchored protein